MPAVNSRKKYITTRKMLHHEGLTCYSEYYYPTNAGKIESSKELEVEEEGEGTL